MHHDHDLETLRNLAEVLKITSQGVARLVRWQQERRKPEADDWDDCNRRIAHARWQLHEAIEDHGYDSRQARHWRHELHEEHERQEHLRRRYRDEQWREREWRERRDYDRNY